MLRATGAGLIFLSEVLVARALGYGVFATISAWLQVLTPVAMLGTNYILSRMVPVYVEDFNWPQLRGLFQWCLGDGLLGSFVIYTIIYLTAFYSVADLKPENKNCIFGRHSGVTYVLSLQRQAIFVVCIG